MVDERGSKSSRNRRIGVIDIDIQPIHYPQDFLKATSAGPDLGPLGNVMSKAGQGVLAISVLASCAPAVEIVPTPTKESGQPHTGAIFETHDFTEFYKTDPSVKDLMAQLEEKNGAFDQSWSLNSIQSEKSVNTVQFFGFEEAHVVGFWTIGTNQEPLLLKENIQPIKGRYVHDNTSGTLTYELMVNGTDTTVSQTFLKMSVDSNSLTSLDSLVMSANSGDADAQAKLTDMLSSNKGNFTIELTNLASGRTDIGTLSPNQMTEVPPTALPSQPSLLDRIMAMGVTPVSALGIEPTVQATPTPVLSLEQQASLAEYITTRLYDEVIGQYTNAYGLETTNVQLHTEIKTGEDGIPHAFQLDSNGVPLFILKDGKWANITMKDLAKLNGMDIGISLDGREDIQLTDSEFSVVTPSPWILTDKALPEGADYYQQIAQSADAHGLDIYGPHLFSHALFKGEFPHLDYLKTTDAQTVENWMRERASDIFKLGPGVDFINVDNEAIYEDAGQIGWEDSPQYRAFGKDLLKKEWHIAYEAALQAGLDPNNITFMFNNYNNEWPNLKSKFYHDFAIELQNELKAEGINLEHPVGIGMQFHIIKGPQDSITWWGPDTSKITYDGLLEHFKNIGEAAPISITELTARGANDSMLTQQEQAELFNTVVRAAVDSGKVQNIIFWESFHQPTLFDLSTHERLLTYFEVEKAFFAGLK